MNTTISLKQLRTDMPAVIEAVSKGKTFTVIKRSRPVLTIAAPEDTGWDLDLTEVSPNGVPIEDVMTALKEMRLEEDGRQAS